MISQASVYLPDLVRYFSVFVLLTVLILLPKSIGLVDNPSKRGWLFITALELTLISQVGLVVSRMGHPLLASNAAFGLAGELLFLVYCIHVIWRRGG